MSRGTYGFDFTYPVAGGTSTQIIDALIGVALRGPVSARRRAAPRSASSTSCRRPTPTTRIRQAAAVLLSSPEFLTH